MPLLLPAGRSVLTVAALLAVAVGAAAQTDARRPPLYLAEQGGTKVYLLGSVHVLPEGALPLPAHVEALFTAASVVAFEIDLDAAAERAADLFAAATDEASVGDLLDDDQRAALYASMEGFGMPAQMLDPYEPWFAGMTYGMLSLKGDGSFGEGVDAYLFRRAGEAGKEILALETLADQIEAFDRLSDTGQVAYLMDLVATSAGAAAAFDELVDAWGSGDDARLSAVLAHELGDGEVFESLLARRNRAWIPTIVALLNRPRDVSLVVVGAGHLVGPENVIALLRAQGVKVRRL
ncbi:TraB/GumN family protein [Rubrivirga sp. IMCC45206]|uniref:TraB/GumN family protein n=1 Tax=Rubrivirga sp. IMCC45206 TaxID=3391614 RepID=UPI00398FD893